MDDKMQYVIEDPDELGSNDTSPAPAPIITPSRKRLLIIVAIILVLLLLFGLGAAIVTSKKSTQSSTNITVNTQTLSSGALQRLEQQTPGSTVNEQLTINPNTIFKNGIAVQGGATISKDLQVAGNLGVDGNTNLGGNLSVSGLITATSLNVGGLSIKSLHLTGDATISGHIIPNGSNASIKTDVAAAGGTATIDGNDTAGTVTITIGSGRLLAGELAIITFHAAYGTTPKVQLTPVNAAAASLQYYVTQSPTFFSVETGSVPTAGASYTFNYFVTQ